jgi:hypothetical protein
VTREALIEVMARAMCKAEGKNPDREEIWTVEPGNIKTCVHWRWQNYGSSAEAALLAIEASGAVVETERVEYIVEVHMPWMDLETDAEVHKLADELGGKDWHQLNADLPKWKRLGIRFDRLDSALILARKYGGMLSMGELTPFATMHVEGWSTPLSASPYAKEPGNV